MKKIFRQFHLWLSLPAGISIFLLCVTGAILVFQKEIQQVINPSYYFVKEFKGKSRLPADSLKSLAAQMAGVEKKQVVLTTFYADPSRTVLFGIAGKHTSFLTLDPYTGKIAGQGNPGGDFFSCIHGLHRWLMLSGENRIIGRTVVGVSTIFLLVILVSGIVIAIPQKRNQWKQFLTIRRGQTPLIWWYTSHRALGWYCVIFLLLMAATGPMWSFEWYRSGVAKLLGATEQTAEKDGQRIVPNKPLPRTGASQWDIALDQIGQLTPNYTSASFFGKDNALVKTRKHHDKSSDTYWFNSAGDITAIETYESNASLGRKIMGYAYVLHTGSWGGWIVKLLYFIAALGGAYLTVSGYWLYWKRLTAKC